MSDPHSHPDREEIAIIGMAGRFPGAADVEQLWRNVVAGVASIRPFSPEELEAAGVPEEVLNDPDFVNAGALLDDPTGFDAAFFGMSPREAEITDPQHRLLLECAWVALEHAGYDPKGYEGTVGVFGGVAPNTYFQKNVSTHVRLLETLGNYPIMIANEREYATTRIAFKLDLKGPSLAVQTACSTSGVAIHLAAQSLLNGESDLALAGGARIRVPLTSGYLYQEDGILSPDGTCRTFDAKARGTVVGNGAAMVVLKRLSDALRDGDTVHAVIKGTAINNDGADKVGFTAPSVQGQAAVIAEAQALAEVDADSIGYVEAHGTATSLGDPIEVAALTQAFRETSDRNGYCAIGSVKSNIGHLDAGAGAAGVIKATMALRHRQLPPTANFDEPNPQIDFANSPFFVSDRLRPWSDGPTPRRAGVSSFGLGGTNAHIVLEEAPDQQASDAGRPYQLLLLSARSENAVDRAVERLGQHLQDSSDTQLADVAYTLQVGRHPFEHRRILVASDRQDAVDALSERSPLRLIGGRTQGEERGVVFLFSGSAAQRPDTALGLYSEEASFRSWVDRCAELLEPLLKRDIRAILFPELFDDRLGTDESRELLNTATYTLPALFTLETAMARMWMAWGVRPAAVMGHDVGEIAAAYLSGVVSLEDALTIVTELGMLQESAFLRAPMEEAELRSQLGEGLDVAAIDLEGGCVVSGTIAAIAALQRTLVDQGVDARRIDPTDPLRSGSVRDILDARSSFLDEMDFRTPELPYLSVVEGDWVDPEALRTPEYWKRQLVARPRLSEALERVFERSDLTLFEVGPWQALTTFARSHPARDPDQVLVAPVRSPHGHDFDLAIALSRLGQLWMAGAAIEWSDLHRGARRRRVPLPGYPFERRPYWLDPVSSERAERLDTAPASPEAGHRSHDFGVDPGSPGDSERTPLIAMQPTPTPDRRERIVQELKKILFDISGFDPETMDEEASFLELGFDSLLLTEASASVKRIFKVKITFRQLFDEAPSIAALATFIDGELDPDAFALEVPEAAPAPLSAPPPSQPTTQPGAPDAAQMFESASALERLVNAQLQVMREQLALMGGHGVRPDPIANSTTALVPPASAPTPTHVEGAEPPSQAATVDAEDASPADAPPSKLPWRPIEKGVGGELTEQQQRHLDALIDRVTRRTMGSKHRTQQYRPTLSDPRTVAGFRRTWKELVYPIFATHASGSRLRDVDGNDWVDITMGFGVTLFGHSPSFVTEAIVAQAERSVAIGPQTELAGQVAELITEFTGLDRVAFCNTGSEAVLAALRIARTVTGRSKTVMFSGDYHGIFDEVLVRGGPNPASLRSFPVAPGIPARAVEGTIVLEFGSPESLALIEQHADDIAAVVVEPVQSRILAIPAKDYYRELRALTERLDIALIFDEVITGFRIHPGGAQALFGVKADIATYGKVIGGGMPIGAIAGRAKYLDALDGGAWSFGDDSVPEVGVTWFAGTFVRHPLAMAAAHASLQHLKDQGPELQASLNRRTADLARRLNAHFARYRFPIRISTFASLFRVEFEVYHEIAPLFWYHLRDHGIHAYEGRTNFLTTAHSDDDVDQIVEAFKASAQAMRDGGFLPDPGEGEPFATSNAWRPAADQIWAESALTGAYPMSEQQKEIWLACQLSREASCAYNLSSTIDLRGPFDVAAMQGALQAIVDRHESLRMSFDEVGERFRVRPQLRFELPVVDLTDRDADAQAAYLEQLLDREMETPFDLERGPLLRGEILRLAKEEHKVVVTVHHIAADGWSNGILLRELGVLYSAAVRGERADLDDAPRYTDYSLWQQEQLATPEMDAAAAFWEAQFTPTPPPLELPTDRPRPSVKTFSNGTFTTEFDRALVAALKRFGSERGATTFATMLAGFSLLLHKLTGQDDLVVGIPASGQPIAEMPDLIGHCAHHYLIRSRLPRSARFDEHLLATRERLLDAYGHRHYTEGLLVPRLELPRDPSRLPLVNVHFNIDPEASPVAFHGVASTISPNARHYFTPDLGLNMLEADGALVVRCDFNTDLFDEATVRRWMDGYRTLLHAFLDEPEVRLSDLHLVDAAERERLLVTWNDTVADYPDQPFHRQFEEQVRQRPDATAVLFDGSALSYTELDERANRLARHLQRSGVGFGDLVGIALDRSLEMMVALLAVHKAGAAYVPLDPDFPQQRIAFMMQDAKLRLLISHSALVDRLPANDVETVLVDRDRAEIELLEASNLDRDIPLEQAAYVIYTSGSTGRPKGVVVPHRALTNFLSSMALEPGMTPEDRLLAVTTLSFDIAALELFLPLSVGAAVEIASRSTAADGVALRARLDRGDITVMQATPATWYLLLEAGWRGGPAFRVLCGGEAFPRDLADRLLPRAASVWNMYGPTETTIWSAVTEVAAEDGPVFVGRPIGNTTFYILDDAMQPVPIGVAGELHIGGVGLADGYLDRPDLTADRFVPHPFEGGSARLYKTGDLVRHTPDGRLEFLGRLDNQIKLHGYRIELGEIETALAIRPEIQRAVVVIHGDALGDARLIAYLEGGAGATLPTSGELRDHLVRSLPPYMVPARFIWLDAFPLTPNNKVDRRALPAPELDRPDLANAFAAPRNGLEERLVGLWQDVLGLDGIGIHDNFFELGGDSMLVMQVVTKARKLELQIVPRDLFRFQTIAELARHTDDERDIIVEQGPVVGPVPLTPGQRRFLEERDSPDPHHWNISTLLAPELPLDADLLRETVRHLLGHHDTLRLRLTHTDRGWEQRSAPLTDSPPIVRVDLSEVSDAEREIERRTSELQASLDLANGPLLRVALFDLGDRGQRLFVTIHHFAIDAISWTIFWEDFQTVYEQLEQGITPTLPTKTSSFRSWARGLDDLAQSEALKGQAGAWLDLPWSRVRPIPTDASGLNTNGSADVLRTTLGRSASETLLHKLPKPFRLEDLLITALALTLAEWTESDTALFDLLRHGRDHPVDDIDLTRTVGFFVSYTPMVVDVGSTSHLDLLARVANQPSDLPERGASYDLLRYLCRDDRVAAPIRDLPRAEILLNHRGQYDLRTTEQSGGLRKAPERKGSDESDDGVRYYPVSVSSRVEEGQLHLTFVYSVNLHHRSTVERIAERLEFHLESLISALVPQVPKPA